MNNRERIADLETQMRINTLLGVGLTIGLFVLVMGKIDRETKDNYTYASRSDLRELQTVLDHPGVQVALRDAVDKWEKAHPDQTEVAMYSKWRGW